MIFKNAMFSKMFSIRRATPTSVTRKLLWSTITLLFLLWSQLAFGSALSNLAASMQPGQWVAFPTNGFNDGHILQAACYGGGSSMFQYQDKSAWLPTASIALVLGGIHMETRPGCYGTKVWRYTESNNTWDEVANVVPNFDSGWSNQGAYTTGHDYHNDTASTVTGDVYHKENGGGSGQPGKVMRWNAASNSWSQCTPLPPSSWQVTAALEYFPDRNSLVMLDGDWGVWEQVLVNGDCTVNSWVQRASTNGGGFSPQLTGLGHYSVQSKYSLRCHCIVLGGGGGTNKLYRY